MGKAALATWHTYQKTAINLIYALVLKHGWSIKLDEITPSGTYVFELQGMNIDRNNWTEDWQFHELPSFQTKRVILMEYPTSEEQWTVEQ